MQSNERLPVPDISTFGCRGLGSTADGSIPLRNPYSSSSPMSQNARQMNLNPRRRKRKGKRPIDPEYDTDVAGPSSQQPSFVSATNIYNEPLASLETKTNPFQFAEWKPIFKKSKVVPQKNNLLNYQFTKTSPEKKIDISIKEEVNIKQEDGDSDVEIICTVDHPKDQPSASSSQNSVHLPIKTEESSQSKNEDPYGLLGLNDLSDWQSDSDFDEFTANDGKCPDFLSQLPEHVLESIFAFMPLTDLLLNISLVCTRFKDIILNPKFLQWKKHYHGLKFQRSESVAEVRVVVQKHGVDDLHQLLPRLPICLLNFRRVSREYDQDMVKCLTSHHKFVWATKFIQENCPDCLASPEKEPNPWSVIGALVVLSDSVSDVESILQLLSRSLSQIHDVTEALYCLASILFMATTEHKALYGLHYYVFYALYQFENEWQAKASDLQAAFYAKGQQNILKYSESQTNVKMTHEQMRIVNHPLRENQIVKVVAFAGTGKTSTLIHFAKMRQGMRFLLLVYNKAAQQHSNRVFPGNVECRTMSSMAFSEGPGRRFKRKLVSKVHPLDIMRYLQKNEKVKMDRNTYARHVLTTIEKFMSSSDPCLTIAHVSSRRHSRPDEEPLTDEIALSVVRDAEVIWSKMVDPHDFEVRMVHDGYLKLYQLEHPVWNDYACIMVDEAQDCTPAMLDIVLRQRYPKILVGDPNQQIYSFRGAVNALDSVQGTHIYYLTQSFRFGPEIAYVAHCALAVLKKVVNKTLVGGKQKSRVNGEHEGQLAIIARCNATLFKEAVRLVCKGNTRAHEPLASEIRGAFVGGISGYNLSQLVDIYNLMNGRNGSIKDKFISRFSTFAHLQTYAKKAKDVELNGKVNLVLIYEHHIPEYVKTVTEKCKYDMKFANVVFTTTHKAKGLEFDTVCLTDDFNLGSMGQSEDATIKHLMGYPGLTNTDIAAEFNVLYVALTRAKKCLLLCEPLRLVLLAAQENFETLLLLESEQEVCRICKKVLTAENTKTFVLHRKTLAMMSGIVRSPGFFCKECAGPIDDKDLHSGFCIMDKTRHAYANILGSQIKPPRVSIFDIIEVFL